ncbi:MAG: hypothetical protein NT034_03295, partial [Candidatus Magasanikbacteria bacterium]|nr:hypothetical protein [Candidatus Magasanikbacteria bacterium]
IREINLSDQAKKAAESFVKELQDQDLQEEFRKAGEAIQQAVESGDPNALETLADNDVYVRSMKMAKKASHASEVLGIVQKESEAAAETEYVDKGVRGYGTPSSALVSVAKKYGDDLNSLNNAALAKALMDNLSFVAETGGTDDISKRAALFGTVSKVTSEAYIDDTIGAMADEINRLYNPSEVAKMSDPEKAKIKKMEEVFAGELGLFRKNTDKDGKITGYTGISNAKASSLMQNYAITGGNMGMMKSHQKIERAMAANDKLSYSEAAQQELGDDGAKSYLGQMKKMDTFFKEATSSFKNGALAAGHLQLGGHQKFDEKLGFHRMATSAEAEAIMQSEVRKRGSKAGYQYHSLGNMNTGNGVLENVDGTAFGNTIGKVTTHLEVKNVQDRTVDALMGYQPSVDAKVDDNGFGMLGGSDVRKNFGSDKAFLRRVILPQLAKGPQAFALVAARKFGNVNLADAQNGTMKVAIGNIKAESLSQLIEAVQTELAGQLGEYADDLKSSLEKAKALEASRPRGGGGGGGGRRPGPTTSDDDDDSPTA